MKKVFLSNILCLITGCYRLFRLNSSYSDPDRSGWNPSFHVS